MGRRIILGSHMQYSDMNLNLYVSCSGLIHIKCFVTSVLAYCMIALQHVNCVVFKSSHDVIWQVPDFQPVVRDRVMNRTFGIVSPHFPRFSSFDWFAWFHLKLVPVLPSFSPMMLKNATSNINCTNYHVVWVAFYEQARPHCTKVQDANEGLSKTVSLGSLQCEWNVQSIPCNGIA